MEQRNSQEVTALMDVAYVVCYGHYPDSEKNVTVSKKDFKLPIVNVPKATEPKTPPNSPLHESNPFPDGDTISDDGNPFADDSNPFADDGNPFSDDLDESEDSNATLDESNPFSEDNPDNPALPKAEESQSKSSTHEVVSKSENSTSDIVLPAPQSSSVPNQVPVTKIDVELLRNLQVAQNHTDIDPNSPLAKALHLKDIKSVSQALTKAIVSEAFNLTNLDLNRLLEDTLETKPSPSVELLIEEIRTDGLPVSSSADNYPILFLRARIGSEDTFINFSSTSATNTIQQSLTLAIQNMYNDRLSLEVWSANIEPPEDPETRTKLDFFGRIMTGSIRMKKDDARLDKIRKISKDTSSEVPQIDIDLDVSCDSSCQSTSPRAIHLGINEKSHDSSHDSDMQNGDTVDHEDPTQSLDMSDSVSVASELSTNDPISTSTPREKSSSLQHLEATNTSENFQRKKGFRSSFKMKASNFLRSSQSNLRRSNQSLYDNSASPNLSRRGSNASSIMSESTDTSIHNHGEVNGKGKLDRESSRSTLSISSITRRTFSMRLSTKKAISPMKRFGSVRTKKSKDSADAVSLSGDQKSQEHLNVQQDPNPVLQKGGPERSNDVEHDSSVEYQNNQNSSHSHENIHHHPHNMSLKKLLSRPMRPFENLKLSKKNKIEGSNDSGELSPTPKSPTTETIIKAKIPNNPAEIQEYLTKIGKGNLQAERIAHGFVPIKTIIGTWVKEGWIPMILASNPINDASPNKKERKKKKDKLNGSKTTNKVEGEAKVLSCRMHIKLSLPQSLEAEDLSNTAFETYNSTYGKLVNLQTRSMQDLTNYKGSVGVVGDVLLEQIIFFSRVSLYHQQLASWLAMSEKKPSDSTLLLPSLVKIKEGLHAGQYITAQKLKLGESLSNWIRYIMPKEFEMLHSSFPPSSHILHLPRLEHFLRCFNLIEESELRILFEREMNLINLPSLTDQLKGALVKNSEIWIDALNKEPLTKESNLNLEAMQTTAEESRWHDALRRAAHLTKPIDDFVVICVHTYQPIFMTEMLVDYLYWVLPKFLTAALHLISKTHRFSLNKIRNLPKEYHTSAAQAIWKICSNISSINKTGVDSKLPIHLIEKDFRTAYSNTVLQWLTLSEILSLEELENDIQNEEFVAVDRVKGYSHSAVSMADILKAIMSRLKGLCWPGGFRPGMNTLSKIAKHVVSLVKEYTNKITHTYTTRGGNTDRIPTQVCVIVRNVEHVCDEARQHLTFLATWANDGNEVEEELPADEGSDGKELTPEGRNHDLQKQIDYAAEILLQRCLPKLEQTLTQGVSRDSSEFIIRNLETSLQPIVDQLYFAEPLLFELWNRLFQHAMHLKGNYLHGLFRRDLLKLEKVLNDIYSFLTDNEKVGFQLPHEAVQEYEALIAELKLVGASSSGLVAKYYSERYAEQCKELDSNTTPMIVTNVTFSKNEGLSVYIAQAPCNDRGGILVKARVEPQEWFPNAQPQKTKLVKGEQAVFDETLHFYEVPSDGPLNETEESIENIDVGGSLVLQIRTPRLLSSSAVHYEAIIPLASVPRVTEETRNTIQHLRLPLTRPWSSKNYKSLETLRSRTQDGIAVDFLKAWRARWEGSDDVDSMKISSSFLRVGSIRKSGMSTRRKMSKKDTSVK